MTNAKNEGSTSLPPNEAENQKNDKQPPAKATELPANVPQTRTEQEAAELTLLRETMHALLTKMSEARGKNISVKLDNLFAVIPALSVGGYIPRLQTWYYTRTEQLKREAEAAEARRSAIASAALAKLDDEERAALGL